MKALVYHSPSTVIAIDLADSRPTAAKTWR